MDENNRMSPPPSKITEDLLLDFGSALKEVCDGHKITRLSFDPKDDCYGLIVDGYLTIHKDGKFHNWQVNDGDILATDWMIVTKGVENA